MRIISEISLKEFKPWSGAVDTFDTVYNAGMMDDLEAILEELYPDGITDTELNDLLWFEDDWIYEMLGISEEDEVEDDWDDKEDEEDEDDLDESLLHENNAPYEVAKYKGNQYGIWANKSSTWVAFGKKADLEKRVKKLNAAEPAETPEQKADRVKGLLRDESIKRKVSEGYYTGSIYTDEEIEEAVDEILNNYDLVVTDAETDEDGASVCVTDNTSGINFWFDLWVDSYGDLDGDWNQYIFHTNDFDDAVKSLVQDNTYFFNEVMEKAEDYAFANGLFTYDGETGIIELG